MLFDSRDRGSKPLPCDGWGSIFGQLEIDRYFHRPFKENQFPLRETISNIEINLFSKYFLTVVFVRV